MTQIGKTAEARLRLLPPHPAEGPVLSPEEGFPAVVAMHRAASKLLEPLLVPGQDSVTVETRITHYALAAHGEVRAVATYLGAQDRRHFFRVHVFDDSGLIAGRRNGAGQPRFVSNTNSPSTAKLAAAM